MFTATKERFDELEFNKTAETMFFDP